jgi:hypothetical protein
MKIIGSPAKICISAGHRIPSKKRTGTKSNLMESEFYFKNSLHQASGFYAQNLLLLPAILIYY